MVHIVSDASLQREGYVYRGGAGVPAGLKPKINWTHIDGPLLYTSDCGLHGLTSWERIQMAFGLTDIVRLNQKHRRA